MCGFEIDPAILCPNSRRDSSSGRTGANESGCCFSAHAIIAFGRLGFFRTAEPVEYYSCGFHP